MSCDRKTKRCPDARNYGVRLHECCRGHLIEMMRDVADALTTAGVTWWADYGTLLGAVRNPTTTWADYPWLEGEGPIAPGIVPHDKDIDLGALHADYNKAANAITRLRGKGYHIVRRPAGAMLKIYFSFVNHTNIDIFFWRENKGHLYRTRYITVDNFKGRNFQRDMAFPLTTVEWEGLTLPAPRDPAAFCEFRYGPNWRTPVCANHDGVRR